MYYAKFLVGKKLQFGGNSNLLEQDRAAFLCEDRSLALSSIPSLNYLPHGSWGFHSVRELEEEANKIAQEYEANYVVVQMR